jgi:two-component system cell cycle response regulator DivK
MAKTVLIVEDNELNMRLFNDLLQASGYDTLQACVGLDAIPLAEARHPDLILMDIRLPDISGLEVTKMLKAREDLRHIPVIAITASHLKGDEQRYRDQGCDGFIAKPISVPLFLETVEKFLEEDEGADRVRA